MMVSLPMDNYDDLKASTPTEHPTGSSPSPEKFPVEIWMDTRGLAVLLCRFFCRGAQAAASLCLRQLRIG